MSIWTILGIDETKDVDIIKSAYREKLTKVNPEDDAEGFMQLRKAYDDAVKYAEEEDIPDEEANEEYTGVSACINDIYTDFYKRIDSTLWEELFDSDYFVSLDMAEDSFYALMDYITEHFYLPHKIFRLIVDRFDIQARRKELGEIYSENFLSYMINNARYTDSINYYLLSGDERYFEDYINGFLGLNNEFWNYEAAKRHELFDELSKLPVTHPYLEMLRIKIDMQDIFDSAIDNESKPDDSDERSRLKEDAVRLLEAYPDDIKILNTAGDVALAARDYDMVLSIDKKINEVAPKNYANMGRMAQMYYMQEDYEAAKNVYKDMLEIEQYDSAAINGVIGCNKKLIEEDKQKLSENPEDFDLRIKLARSYFENQMYDEALAVLDGHEPIEDEALCRYYNTKGRALQYTNQYEEAIECYEKWETVIHKVQGDELKKLPFVHIYLASCYLNIRDFDKALSHISYPVETLHDQQDYAYEVKCRILYEMGHYDECLDCCEKLLARDERNYGAYIYKAKSCFELDYLTDCHNACRRAIDIFPYRVTPYEQEIKLFMYVEQYDDAENVIAGFRQMYPDSETMKYYEAEILRERGEYRRAKEILTELIQSYNKNDSDFDDETDMYLLIADICDELDEDEEAVSYYKLVEEKEPQHIKVHGYLGYMYRKMKRWQDAIDEYNIQIELERHPNYYVSRGMAYKGILDYENALKDFHEALEMDPGRTFCLYQTGITYLHCRRFAEAVEAFDNTLKLEKDEARRQDVIRMKSRACACLGRYDEATGMLQEIIDKYGCDADFFIRYDLALTYTRDNRYEMSEKILRDYLEQGTDNDDKYEFASLLMELAGEENHMDTALWAYDFALSIKNDDGRVHGKLGRLYLLFDMFEEAKDKLLLACRMNADYYSEFIYAVSRLGEDFTNLYSDISDKVMKTADNLTSPKQYIDMVRWYNALGEYETALYYADGAINAMPCTFCGYAGCDEGYYEQGLIYENMGDYEKADEAFRKAVEAHGHCYAYERRIRKQTGF